MLFFSETRAGQLADYTRRIAKGDGAIDAAQQAFGDLDELDLELDRYLKLRRMSAITINAGVIGIETDVKSEVWFFVENMLLLYSPFYSPNERLCCHILSLLD